MKLFKDRKAAGKLLAERLKHTKADLVLGIPRGGIVVAAEVAKELKIPLDILVIRKIGAPTQPELALGAIDPDGEAVWDQALLEELRIKKYELMSEIQKEWKELKRREDLYRGEFTKYPTAVGKSVILVDDGMATGETALAAIKYLKRHRLKKIILALPVASKEAVEGTVREMGEVGEVIVLYQPEDFRSVGQFYSEFEPVNDEGVVELLK